ncbi:AsmA family protein [Sulfurospirillum oryzae]|uniref:AsmA family protein n=1 Tax=Sulfurospirillum oryzae TaxID=2976535 RepID=UPI0021E77569|nr:AsmA family protein [Sulfurospirillum oryzae]
MFQKILIGTVLFFAFCLVTFFFFIKVIDFNEYKPRIHKAVKESTGYDVVIRGDVALSLSPFGVSFSDIEITNPTCRSEMPFAKIGSFDVALDMPALLKKEIKVKQLSLDSLDLTIAKNKEGKFNYELASTPSKVVDKKSKESNTTLEKEEGFSLANIKKMKFSNANVTYAEDNVSSKMTFEKIDFDMNDINYDLTKNKLQGLSFIAETHIDKIQYSGSYAVQDIAMTLEMKNAVAVAENLKYTLFDTPIQGSGKFDVSGKQPKISIKSKIVGLKLASLSKALWNKEMLEGNANGDFKLSFFVGDSTTFKSTLNGFVQLFGEGITLKGYDIDKIALVVDPFQKTKGISLNTLITGTVEAFKGGNTLIKEANTKVDLGYSEMKLSDVALSTQTNRIATKGAINIVEDKLIDVKVALLDEKGCASVEQKFSGTLAKPSLKMDEATVTTLSNVVLSFTTKSKSTHTPSKQNDENCPVFYDGVIKHPPFIPPVSTPTTAE